ncbi:MAG: AIR synthase-related protein [Vampirovibrionales bacterium]
MEAFATGAIVAAQDMGAAGLTCSGAEMSAKGGVGMRIDLDQVPARESNMQPHEYLLSESQERMLMVVEQGREEEVMALFHRWGLAACVVGTVIAEPRLQFWHHGVCVADVPPLLLTDEAPLYEAALNPEEPSTLQAVRQQSWNENQYPDLTGPEIMEWLIRMVQSPNVARPTGVYDGYDRHVRNNTLASSENNGAGVIRLRDTQGRLTQTTLVATVDGRSRDSYLNAYEAGKGIVAEAARNLAVMGAKPLAVTNNLNFGDPEKPEPYYHMAQAVRGMKEACEVLQTPVTGGNVSLYNERGGTAGAQAILPSPVIGMVGVLSPQANGSPRVSYVNQSGLTIALVGRFAPALGGSEYQWLRTGELFGEPPSVHLETEKRLIHWLSQMPQGILAAQDVSTGGVLVSLLELLIGPSLQPAKPNDLGIVVNMDAIAQWGVEAGSTRTDAVFFGETHGSVLVACETTHEPLLFQQCQAEQLSCTVVATTTSSGQWVMSYQQQQFKCLLSKLQQHYNACGPLALQEMV